jgi:hypothetical protein
MIRSAFASPWLPLAYWTAVVVSALCASGDIPFRRHPHLQAIEKVSAAVPARVNPGLTASQSLPRSINAEFEPVHFWNPEVLCLNGFDTGALKVATEAQRKAAPAIVEAMPIATPAPGTMLSIRADPPAEPAANVLSIQCRTKFAVSNAHGPAVAVHGVVSQEVVSSEGKILIMAGSRVVGSGVLDQESGRLGSDGLWSIFFDNTEMKVRARILDRPGGVIGVIGQVKVAECGVSKANTGAGGGRLVVVPANVPFTLELHGEIQLRDLASSESAN